eukprot:3939275-Rhodomonas_salina.1
MSVGQLQSFEGKEQQFLWFLEMSSRPLRSHMLNVFQCGEESMCTLCIPSALKYIVLSGAPPELHSVVTMGVLGEARVSHVGTFVDLSDFESFMQSKWSGRGGAALWDASEVFEVMGLERNGQPRQDKQGIELDKKQAFSNNKVFWFAVERT